VALRTIGKVIATAVALCVSASMPLQASAQGSPVQPMPVTPPPGAAKLPLGTPLIVTKQARFHAEPHPSSDIISLLPAGTPVVLAGPWGASWVQIRYQNKVGYVLRSLVRPTQ
jgi:uncharacterized protein YraI